MQIRHHKGKKHVFLILLIVANCLFAPNVAYGVPGTSNVCGSLQLQEVTRYSACIHFGFPTNQNLAPRRRAARVAELGSQNTRPKGKLQYINFFTGQSGNCSSSQSLVTNAVYYTSFNLLSPTSITLGCKRMSVYGGNGRVTSISFYTGKYGSCSGSQSAATDFFYQSSMQLISPWSTTLGCKRMSVYGGDGRVTSISFYTGKYGSCSGRQSLVTDISYDKYDSDNPVSTSKTTLGCKSVSVLTP